MDEPLQDVVINTHERRGFCLVLHDTDVSRSDSQGDVQSWRESSSSSLGDVGVCGGPGLGLSIKPLKGRSGGRGLLVTSQGTERGRYMGLFRKPAKSTDQPDEAMPFFSAPEANALRELVRRAFAERGMEVVVHPDHAVDDRGRQFGFWNLGAQCADAPPGRWPGLVADHLHRVLASSDTSDPFDSLSADEATTRTYARLHPVDGVPTLEPYPHREFVPGVVEMLALDLPEAVAYYSHENSEALGGWEALRAAGIRNLKALPVEQLELIDAPGGGSFTVLLGNSVHTASRALLLPELAAELRAEPPPEHGWLMSVPNRQQVIWHVVRDISVINVVNAMAQFTALGHSDAPGPVSPHLYWWNGSAYEQLTQFDDGGRLAIHPSPGFTDILNDFASAE